MKVNIWIACNEQTIIDFKERQAAGEDYTGDLDDVAYAGLCMFHDLATVQPMFKPVVIDGTKFLLNSIYFKSAEELAQALAYVTGMWPERFVTLGAWHMDGLQVGEVWATQNKLDEEDQPIQVSTDEDGAPIYEQELTGEVAGTPVYTLYANAFDFMPDVVAYDEEGAEASRVAPSSNADLRDINLLGKQVNRKFN
jgi:hypothetical protein